MEKIQFKDLPNMTTPLSSANLNQMQDNMENAIIPIKLVSISDTAPASATIGDMYYNTTDNKVYTATAENTWDNGSTPRYDGFYINTNDNTLFYYDGNTLILSGGNLTDKNIKNEETTSDTDVYSCNYINERYEKLRYNVVVGTPIETGVKKMGKKEYCIAYHFTNINAINTYSTPLGFTLADKIITGIDVVNLATSGAWFLPTASDSTASEAASVALRPDNTIKITTKTGNIKESYVYVSYIDKN